MKEETTESPCNEDERCWRLIPSKSSPVCVFARGNSKKLTKKRKAKKKINDLKEKKKSGERRKQSGVCSFLFFCTIFELLFFGAEGAICCCRRPARNRHFLIWEKMILLWSIFMMLEFSMRSRGRLLSACFGADRDCQPSATTKEIVLYKNVAALSAGINLLF